MPRSFTALKGLENNSRVSLYIHVPFCNSKCSYCDFFSVTDHSLMSQTLDKTLEQTTRFIEFFGIKTIPTVYIGGGTPTSLPSSLLRKLLDYIGTLPLEKGAECTIEANPETVDSGLLSLLSSSCINRLSLGIQSFSNSTLKTLGRHCNFKTNFEKLELIKGEWQGNLSLDLISSVPGQALSESIKDIDAALLFKPDHISLYALTLEEGTPLSRLYQPGDSRIDENVWIKASDYLEECGYRRYEVSNFALPGCQSFHNMRYWHLLPYIGTGAGGVSTLDDGNRGFFRISNVHDIHSYLESTDFLCGGSTEEIDSRSALFERIMMGFRLVDGVEKSGFSDAIPKTLENWKSRGLMTETATHIALSKEGLLLLNQFLIDALDELDATSSL